MAKFAVGYASLFDNEMHVEIVNAATSTSAMTQVLLQRQCIGQHDEGVPTFNRDEDVIHFALDCDSIIGCTRISDDNPAQ